MKRWSPSSPTREEIVATHCSVFLGTGILHSRFSKEFSLRREDVADDRDVIGRFRTSILRAEALESFWNNF